jgi:hypothetical protein
MPTNIIIQTILNKKKLKKEKEREKSKTTMWYLVFNASQSGNRILT